MYNLVILFFHVAVLSCLTLFAVRFGKELAISWLSMLGVAMNLFVLKQVSLFGLNVTASDALAVGYLLGSNLIQEFFGQKAAKKIVWISFFISSSFALLCQLHLLYQPNRYDLSQSYFTFLLSPMPRLALASLFSFFTVQFLDIYFFNFLRKKTNARFLTLRTLCSLIFSFSLDTILFTFLGLYGLTSSLFDVIIFSLCIKVIITLFMTPFITFSKKLLSYDLQV